MTWRIDDLARTAGITVDTVRYYQREGLLPPPVREGRHVLYGPEHLARLERVRELQTRRFSLAAIRSLLDADRQELVEGIVESSEAAYSFEDLVERSGIPLEVAEALRDSGVLGAPTDFGRSAYDTEDLDVCRALADVAGAGIGRDAIVEIGRIYRAGVEAMQCDVVDTIRQAAAPDQSEREVVAAISSALPRLTRLLAYVQRRSAQRAALGALVPPESE